MYLEEKVISRVLHWRTSPDSEFHPYNLESLTAMVLKLQTERDELVAWSAIPLAGRGA